MRYDYIKNVFDTLIVTVGENESEKYWLGVLNDLKNRGVQDMLILCADGLSGIKEAIAILSPFEYPLVHTDRGCHYRWQGWIERMQTAGLTRSMSKKGCSPDNAAREGFFGRMKNEMIYGRSWIDVSIDAFIDEINNYINWYNTKRIKQSLGYMCLVEYRHSLGLAI